jgi:hypothetical protein
VRPLDIQQPFSKPLGLWIETLKPGCEGVRGGQEIFQRKVEEGATMVRKAEKWPCAKRRCLLYAKTDPRIENPGIKKSNRCPNHSFNCFFKTQRKCSQPSLFCQLKIFAKKKKERKGMGGRKEGKKEKERKKEKQATTKRIPSIRIPTSPPSAH